MASLRKSVCSAAHAPAIGLGALTTVSTFSAEVVTLLSNGQIAWALAAASLHLFGSFALTALGILTVKALA